jgi:Lipocalin-like domain
MRRSNPFLVTLVLTLVFSTAAQAQCKIDIVGTWKLISVSAKTDTGEVNPAVLGQHPSGLLTYTADGRMMAIIPGSQRENALGTLQTRLVCGKLPGEKRGTP